eukprot:TRINITY_DN20652_c0_g1_i1.p1 TRINITY_DN20652_c0_g1~~TRINITY_DN20652_c0_g1_i1.p1  ORF type:complete len:410 (+),score=34.03 TRINITY_DN20652_c0_g1_i1:123-1352(+)
MLHLQDDPAGEILYMSFNQDFTCFVCGTETGFRVYSTDPFRLMHRRDFEHGGGLGVVAMLFRTNILALAGGGKTPRFQPNKVILWDDQQKWVIAELNFRSPVKAVRLRRDLVVVAIESKVFVYSFRKLTLIDSIETTANPKGLCCLSPGSDRVSLVCPGMQQGSVVAIVYPPRAWSGPSAHATVERERTMIIAAHSSPLMAMCTCYNGALLATASDKGTIVRVYDATSGAKLQELRRGWDKAEIHSLTLSPAGDWLAAASEKGTVHVFSVRRNPAKGAQSLYVGLGSPRSNPSGAVPETTWRCLGEFAANQQFEVQSSIALQGFARVLFLRMELSAVPCDGLPLHCRFRFRPAHRDRGVRERVLLQGEVRPSARWRDDSRGVRTLRRAIRECTRWRWAASRRRRRHWRL